MNAVEDVYLLELKKSLKGLKTTAEKALGQISADEFHYKPDPESNSAAIIMKHMSGNMLSRFTDFLTTDGEKEWRNRDGEFQVDNQTKDELFSFWNRGWSCVLDAITVLKPEDLLKVVYIRGEEHTVLRALQRQLAHYAYHTGQIVFICKHIRSTGFQSLSIPKTHS